MALTPEEEAELLELSKSGKVGAEFRAAAAPSGAVIDQPPTPGSESELGGIQAVYGKDWTPYAPGGQPIAQTGDDRARDEAAAKAEADRVASMLDPRFSIVPQVLALQPATNDAQGDEAARAKFEAGKRDPVVIYEPTVDSVRRHLYENPALLRTLSAEQVPSPQEIATLTHDSRLYQDAANWMYQQAQKVATEKGIPIVRYRDASWLTLDPKELAVKAEGAAAEGRNRAQAFVLGADDMLTFGKQRAGSEAPDPLSGKEPTDTLHQQGRLGVNADMPHPRREVNAWTEEEYPAAYALGQLGGMFPRSGVSLFNQLWSAVEDGSIAARAAAGRALQQTRYGAAAGEWLGSKTPLATATREVGGALADAATGAVAGAATQTAQEAVDALGRNEPIAPDAGERIVGTAKTGGYLSYGGSVLRRLSGAGANAIRDSDRYSDQYGRGLVRRTEPNLDWSPRTAITGPQLSQETKALVKRSGEGPGYIPSDLLAKDMAGPIGKAAADNARVSADRFEAVGAGYRRSPEGRQQQPVKQVMEEAYRGLSAHFQPERGGGLRAINDRPPPELKVFNSLVGEASTTAREGALKLTPEQAERFLTPRTQVQLFKDDLEKAARARAGKPDDRAAYLADKPKKARDGINEEIEADIDDLIGFDQQGVPRTVDKRSKEYKTAEQQAIRTRVDAETVLEPFGGSLGEYLKQRGLDGVYVTPRALDAERLDRLIELHGADSRLGKAAALDRRQFSAGGKKGGYHDMLEQQGAEAARHADIQERVAPKGKAFEPLAGLYQSRPGEAELVDDVVELADQAGVRNQLDRLRGLQDTLAVHNRARAAGPTGQPRGHGMFSPTNWRDVAPLRAFPVLRALEGPLGPLRGGTAGRAAQLGGDEAEAAQRRAESGPRGRYEAARARRLKEIEQEKAAGKAAEEREQIEAIRTRRR
jgi:hypothetical protein